jgi:hypothetical protein
LLKHFYLEMLEILPWSTHVVPSHFYLFRSLRGRFSGHRFTFDDNVKHATITWLRNVNVTFYASEMDKFTILCNKYLKPSRGCVEKLLTNDAFILCPLSYY